MKEIVLTQGRVALVDDEDFEYLNQFKWYAWKHGDTFYARRTGENRNSKIYMHREILKLTDRLQEGEHKDLDGLNNQRKNLRIATRSQNLANRRSHKNTVSKYLGVSWHNQNNKWQVNITKDYKVEHVGTFQNQKDAAIAYDIAAKRVHGEFAHLNFPELANN